MIKKLYLFDIQHIIDIFDVTFYKILYLISSYNFSQLRSNVLFVTKFLIMKFMKDWTFLLVSVAMMLIALVGLFVGSTQWQIYGAVVLMGFGNGNPFSIVFARALAAVPKQKNEVSGLLIMGICGGAVFPMLMGAASDAIGSQTGAVVVISVGVLYLFVFWMRSLLTLQP